MNTKNQEPLRLTSMAPLDDGGRKYNIIYVIALVIGTIAGICIHNGIEGIFGANFLTLMVAFAVKDGIFDIKWKRLRKQKFLLENRVPYDALIQHLIGQLSPLGFLVEKGGDGNPVLSYRKMIYDVDYDEGGSFTIYWRKSVANAFFDFRTPIYHYRITVADMGIIGYAVQQICCGDMGGDVQQNTIHGSEEHAESEVRTNAGNGAGILENGQNKQIQKNKEINTSQRNSNDIKQGLYKEQAPLNMLNKKWYIVIGVILFLLIILGGVFWLGNSSDDEAVEGKITNEVEEEAVEETVSAEESYDAGEYTAEDMDGDVSYGLNGSVEFETEDEGKENTVKVKESILLNDLYIDTVSASSELTDSTNTYKVEALFDGNKDTCWAEGVGGNGEGEYVEIWFTNPLYLTEIGFLNGYMKNESVFGANGKIRRAELRFSDGSTCEWNLGKEEYQSMRELLYSDMISFESPVWTDYLRITILEAESGTKYDDTCLTEIAMWGYQDSGTEIPQGTELAVAGKDGQEFYVDSSILGTYGCYMGEDFGAEITLTYDEENRRMYISGNCWAGMNVGMIEDEVISSFVSGENALLYDGGYGNQLYIYPMDTGEIYIRQNGDFGGIGTTFEGTYEK